MVANEVLKRGDISLSAKGMYAYLFSKPSDWDFAAIRISKECKEGRKGVLSALKELENSGLLLREKKGDGRVEYTIQFADIQSPSEELRVADPESLSPTVGLRHSARQEPISNTDKESNTDRKVKKNPARSAQQEQQIADIIDSFKEVNPMYKTLFPRTPQREAAWRLLEQFGFEVTIGMVDYLKISNAAKYAPTITTPVQLEGKLGELKAWADKQRNGSKKTGKGIVNATPV